MKLAVIGIGGAGGRIANAIAIAEQETGETLSTGDVLAFDTDREALSKLDAISPDRRIRFGHTIEDVASQGTAGDPEVAAEAARVDDFEIQRSFDDVPIEELDGLIIAAGLGGGTGSGGGAVILEMCQELFDLPIYAMITLPHPDEDSPVSLNAARALQSFVRMADSVVTFDNGNWLEQNDDPYDEINRALGERAVRLLSLGEFNGIPAEARVDRTDIIRTLSVGGVASIGMATWELELGWRRWFRWLPWVGIPARDPADDAMRLKQLVREAVESSLTVPCDVGSTERALVVTIGPPDVISRKGFESARHWLEDELDTVEIIAGDEPRPRSNQVRALVIFSNVTEVPPIEALKSRAVATLENE